MKPLISAVRGWFDDRFTRVAALPPGYAMVKSDILCDFARHSAFFDPSGRFEGDTEDDWYVYQTMFLETCP